VVAAAEVPIDSVNVPRLTFPEVIVSVEFTIAKVLRTSCGLVQSIVKREAIESGRGTP